MQFRAIIVSALFATAMAVPYGAHPHGGQPAIDDSAVSGNGQPAIADSPINGNGQPAVPDSSINGNGHRDTTDVGTGDIQGKGDNNFGSTGQCSGDRVVACCNSKQTSNHESESGKSLIGSLNIGADGLLKDIFQCSQLSPQLPIGVLGGAAALQGSKSQQCSTPNACCQGDRDTNTGLIVINPKFQCNSFF